MSSGPSACGNEDLHRRTAANARDRLCLVRLFGVTVQHSISVADIELVDDLQLQHSAAFDAVAEYAGLKRPKHHFCAHLARDMWLFGPPRGYWCFVWL